jgi:phosphoglycolate phosphatase
VLQSHPNGFDAVFFDLDGTLVDSAEDIRHALGHAFADIGVDMSARLASLVDGSPLEEIFAVAVPRGSAADMERFITSYRRHYETDLVKFSRLYPAVRETLDALDAMRPRLRLAIATTKRESTARSLADALDIARVFDRIAGSGATTIKPKPEPDLLLAIAADLGVTPSRVLMVGDTLRDVISGQRAGMRTAAVTYGLGNVAALIDARPDYVLEEFDELLVLLGVEA